jgi:ABC-type nitrate/sulfonate/bicarbonate transport system substrate-binding protein
LLVGWHFFSGLSSLHAAELQKLTVAFVAPSEIMAIPWIARETGIYRKHGFDADVVMITGTPLLVQALIAGSFEYAIVGASALLRARIGGADPVILAATSDMSRQRIVAGPGTGIRRHEDLRGKTIGVTQYGSEGDNFLRAALKSVGLQPEGHVTIFQTSGNPQTVVALLAGKLQAASVGRATALAAEQKGAKELLNGHQLNFHSPSGTLATTTRNIQRDPNAVLGFMSAYVEGIHYLKKTVPNRSELCSDTWAA